MNVRLMVACGYNGCRFEHPQATVVGQHRRTVHGIEGQSRTATRRRALTSTSPSPEPPFEWGAWTDEDKVLLRALSEAWGKDLPGTVALLRARTLATVRREPAVKRILHANHVIDEHRRQALSPV